MNTLRHFRYWCYKVIPLVYDDSLSYYEVLCKVVDYINNLIDNDKEQGKDIESLQSAMDEVQEWIKQFDMDSLITTVKELTNKYLEDNLANMIYVRISPNGRIVYYIPKSWKDIKFNTTGLDITQEKFAKDGHVHDYEYGRLVLSMFTND